MLIFLDLKNTKEDYINPIKFINNYKSTIIDIHEQNDSYDPDHLYKFIIEELGIFFVISEITLVSSK